ncbi:hypothetical protein RO3G_01685 [Lichtheimia corymbifera JMRC:FSU:9682]|uniref:RlpA-like protein double-psi beta-barrel domain-containing protein n=1 Tax=Lichtheimia corymbifera JMRC:FSU:9682 TaxID=1263082 RepID=A0A068S9K5_9FUNG|nr:hypothetical protein RO3G_01685 [Lichtheimia corymbifera JMRC:FSU:9682]
MKFPSFALIFLLAVACMVNARPAAGDALSNTLKQIVDAVNKLFEGSATWFRPKTEGGEIGSCGPKESDNDMIVALNKEQYGNLDAKSSWCGKRVLIMSGDKWVDAAITDACPGCKKYSLDLTPAVFKKLADLDKGVIPIRWCVIGEKGCKKPSKGGSSKKHGKGDDEDDEHT